MAGNERRIAEYLFENISVIELPHLGVVHQIGIPLHKDIREIKNKDDLLQLATEDSSKKADIYINNRGISIKQSGAYFLFNRLQRADILNVLSTSGFASPSGILETLDTVIDDFHHLKIKGRCRPWDKLFDEAHFYKLLKFLMMEGSPHSGLSAYPAEFILQAPFKEVNSSNIQVFTFDDYFNMFKNKFEIAIRRSWIGQSSNGEHFRATGLAKKKENLKWVYEDISGSPRASRSTGKVWRDDVMPSDRRTVYYVSIQKS